MSPSNRVCFGYVLMSASLVPLMMQRSRCFLVYACVYVSVSRLWSEEVALLAPLHVGSSLLKDKTLQLDAFKWTKQNVTEERYITLRVVFVGVASWNYLSVLIFLRFEVIHLRKEQRWWWVYIRTNGYINEWAYPAWRIGGWTVRADMGNMLYIGRKPYLHLLFFLFVFCNNRTVNMPCDGRNTLG